MMRIADTAYTRLPRALQDLSITVYGWKLKRQRYGRVYRRAREWLRETDRLTGDQLRAKQQEMFLTFVREACVQSRFYRELCAGTDVAKLSSVEDIEKLPVLSKDMLRGLAEEARTRKRKGDIEVSTGGTTGTPLTVVYRRDDLQKRMAMLDHYRSAFGFENGMRRATFSGRIVIPSDEPKSVFWRTNWSLRQRLYSTFHILPENLEYYARDLERFRPVMVDGFPSAIYEVARQLESRDRQTNWRPKVVFTTSEALRPEQREVIERAFKCRVANQYASSEGAPFVVECPSGALHFDLRSGVVESSDSGGSLVTSFTTSATPLIRYAIGDRIVVGDWTATCSCGSAHPVVESIEGRDQDFLVSRERGKVAVGLIDIFKGIPPVFGASQLVQRSLDEVELVLATTEPERAGSYIPTLETELRKRMGSEIGIRVQLVSGIGRDRSGKLRYIRNELRQDAIDEVLGSGTSRQSDTGEQ